MLWTLGASLLHPALRAHATPLTAPTPTPTGLQVTTQADGIHIQWQASDFSMWPLADMGGYRLPAQLITMQLTDAQPIAIRITSQLSEPWRGALRVADTPMPYSTSLAGQRIARPELLRAPPRALPTSPFVVLRESQLRGARLAVVAFSPIFGRDDGPHVTRRLEAVIPNAQRIDSTTLLSPFNIVPAQPLPSLQATSSITPPTNAAASLTSWKITVTQSGMQHLTGALLASAGVSLSTLNPSLIHVRYNGVEIPLEARDTTHTVGGMSPTSTLRFYAPTIGDRWNASDTYWLTIEATDGLRMNMRATPPTTAPLRSTALEQGVWRDNQIYDSLLAGVDGDHWFACYLQLCKGVSFIAHVPLTPTLPLAAGSAVITVAITSYAGEQHVLQAHMGAVSATNTWQGTGDFLQTYTLADNRAELTLILSPTALIDANALDSVSWTRPVTLDFGGRGAAFIGVSGAWRYQLANADVASQRLYDISNPLSPTLLTISHTLQFEDDSTNRVYLLSGAGTEFTPTIMAHAPINLATPLNAQALYIAPSSLQTALAPLLAHRQAQSYTVGVVDPQAVYDAWSYGQVSPVALRHFLRYATTWPISPTAVILVGDGTLDPLNYRKTNPPNFIPPYLAPVDAYFGETACDTCYAQLDSDDPLSDVLPDVLIGRLPVKSANELTTVITKIIGYETGPRELWQTRNVYFADNYLNQFGAPDGAGDFAAFADASVAQQPSGVEAQRVYYDPYLPTALGVPWRVPTPTIVHARVIDLWNAGAGLINYHGHADSLRLAIADAPYLFDAADAAALHNGSRLPIVLQLSCLTSAFQQLTPKHETLDEQLVLHVNGGGVALWGSAGSSVVYGHDALQRGFYKRLWGTPNAPPVIGALTLGGYLELFTSAPYYSSEIQAYILLGDPLTRARVFPAQRQYLPLTQR
jgi:hypothetical protein